MAPQLLSKVKSDCVYHFNHDSLYERPKLASHVMKVINTWSYTDSLIARLVSLVLRADFEIINEMLQALSGAEARRASIIAAMKAGLPEDDFLLFQAVNNAIKASKKRRNDFCHHVWGIAPEFPDALLLANPKDIAKSEAAFNQQFSSLGGLLSKTGGLSHSPFDISSIYLFREIDLLEDVFSATNAYGLVFRFLFVLRDLAGADETRQQLLDEPRIKNFIQLNSSEKDR